MGKSRIVFYAEEERLVPTKGSEKATGYDLRASATAVIPSGGHAVIATGVSVMMPDDVAGTIRGRSGWASKGILAHVGTIDPDYRGVIGVVLFNLSGKPLHVEKYDRIGQIVFLKADDGDIGRAMDREELSETGRGSGGFGHTGIK
jgi:dUTP pyrophosphatase